MKRFPPGLVALVALATCAVPLHPASAQAAAQERQNASQPIRYLDVTRVEKGWGVAIATAVQASRNNKLVIISYLDPQNTRALYDAAVPFIQAPTNMPIVGLIRSPAAPSTVTDTANPLGFDIFFNGAVFARDTKPDNSFSRVDHLGATLRSIQRNHFAETGGGCFDIEREPDPKTGGLRIPKQRVCPPGKLQPPRASEAAQGQQ